MHEYRGSPQLSQAGSQPGVLDKQIFTVNYSAKGRRLDKGLIQTLQEMLLWKIDVPSALRQPFVTQAGETPGKLAKDLARRN